MTDKKWIIKQWGISAVKLFVAVALIVWLVRSGRFDLKNLYKLKSLWIWICGVILFLGTLAINSKRWQILLRLQGIFVSYGRIFFLSLIGLFFNFFIPGGGVGGDLVKAGYLMGDYKTKRWFIGWSIFVDRIFGVLALLFYSSFTGLFFSSQLEPDLQVRFFFLSLGIILSLFCFFILILFLPKTKIDHFLRSYSFTEKTLSPLFFFFQKPKTIVVPFLLSLLSQALLMSLGVSLVFLLDPGFSPWMIFLIFPFGFLTTVLPVSPAGLGVGQMAFYYLFSKIIGDGDFGILTITFVQAVQFLVALIGGFLFVAYRKKSENHGI